MVRNGQGPRLSTINSTDKLKLLKPVDEIHDTLRPVYETVRILSKELPEETTLIGFCRSSMDGRHLYDCRKRYAGSKASA